jgi:hypothetical protein
VGRTADINGNEYPGCMLEYLELSCLASLHAELSMAKKPDLRSGAGKGASSEQI